MFVQEAETRRPSLFMPADRTHTRILSCAACSEHFSSEIQLLDGDAHTLQADEHAPVKTHVENNTGAALVSISGSGSWIKCRPKASTYSPVVY